MTLYWVDTSERRDALRQYLRPAGDWLALEVTTLDESDTVIAHLRDLVRNPLFEAEEFEKLCGNAEASARLRYSPSPGAADESPADLCRRLEERMAALRTALRAAGAANALPRVIVYSGDGIDQQHIDEGMDASVSQHTGIPANHVTFVEQRVDRKITADDVASYLQPYLAAGAVPPAQARKAAADARARADEDAAVSLAVDALVLLELVPGSRGVRLTPAFAGLVRGIASIQKELQQAVLTAAPTDAVADLREAVRALQRGDPLLETSWAQQSVDWWTRTGVVGRSGTVPDHS